jgi:O-antigen/teichoic acid export membrane protein
VTQSNNSSGGETIPPPADEREALFLIAHGAVVAGGGVSIKRLLSIVIEAILARGLGPVAYGVYALGWRFASMLLRFANGGANLTLLRDIQAYDDDPGRQNRVTGLAYLTTAVASSFLALVLIVGARPINDATIDHPEFPLVLRLFAILLIILAFVRMHGVLFRASKSATGDVVYRSVLRPGTRLAAAAVAVWLGYSVLGVTSALIVGLGLLAVIGYPIVTRLTGITPSYRGLRSELHDFYDHAIPSAISGVGGVLRSRIYILLIGAFLNAEAAGIYNVVLVLIGVAAIPLSAFNMMMPPVASDLHSNGERKTLSNVYSTVSRLIVITTVPLIIIGAVFGRELLAIFGPAYTRGYAVLLIFLIGRFIANAVGATGILLSMTNHQYAQMWLEWLLAFLNVGLTYLFVLKFGLIGAALATSLSIGIQNLLQALLLLRFESLWPFDRTFLKPLFAGFVMGAAALGIRSVLGGIIAVGLGTFIGILLYIKMMMVVGVQSRDKIVIQELQKRYQSIAQNFAAQYL